MKLIAALLLAAVAVAEQDQWRGPNRDGVVPLQGPESWPQKLTRRWKVTVGQGHSSPISSGGKVYVHTRQSEEEVVTAIDPETGNTIWRQAYPAPYDINPAARSHGKGVKSTPAASGGRVYTLGIGGILSCFDAGTGKPAWRKNFAEQFKRTSPAFGTAVSPVLDRGMLMAHVGGKDDGALTAFDAASGAVKWAWKGDGPGYASPLVAELAGTRQVVTQTQKNIVGVSADTGELLWRIPFTTPYEQNIVTPVRYRDLLIFSGLENGTFAVRVSRAGNRWTTNDVWRNRELSMYMSSPVVSGDYLFGMANRSKGQFFCLDLRTGATVWTTNGREGENAAFLDAGGVMLILTDDGVLTVAAKNPKKYEPLRRYTVADSPTWAHPLIVGRAILVKDAESLARWDP